MRKLKLTKVGIVTAGLTGVLFPFLASALSIEPVGRQLGFADANLYDAVIRAVKWFLGFISLVAVTFIIYGGFLWLTSAGDEDRIARGKQTIVRAVIGLIIIILAWAIVLFAFRTTTNVAPIGASGNPATSCNPLVENCTTVDPLTSITLTWTAPGDDGAIGRASRYDIRYATSPISEATFTAATPVANPPTPLSAGQLELFVVTNLDPGTQYYFALKSIDEAGNVSSISNAVTQATAAP